MAPIQLENVTKVYPNGFTAVDDLSLAVEEGEFMVLVGPSGCGKTTALRMVAGLEDITAGTLWIGDRIVNDVAPKERDVAMVFQNYALYPHMTVAENIGFALKIQRVGRSEIRERVGAAAGILGLTDWLGRKPSQLSGGQRQRVAMGRAIVREPAVFLMDEPLSNLDAKLRVQMRAEVSRIQRRLGVAALYVTHDQTEAMTMGDRVAVLKDGVLQQCDTPQALYDRPRNLFVAAFMGSPAMNLVEGMVSADAESVAIGSQVLPLSPSVWARHSRLKGFAGSTVVVGMRPEDMPAAAANGSSAMFEGEVELIEALGSELLVHFTTDARVVRAEGLQTTEDAEGLDEGQVSGSSTVVARVDPRATVNAGERARFFVQTERLHFFDPDSGLAIRG